MQAHFLVQRKRDVMKTLYDLLVSLTVKEIQNDFDSKDRYETVEAVNSFHYKEYVCTDIQVKNTAIAESVYLIETEIVSNLNKYFFDYYLRFNTVEYEYNYQSVEFTLINKTTVY